MTVDPGQSSNDLNTNTGSTNMSEQTANRETLLSLLEKFTAYDALPASPDPHSLHLFASGSSEPPVSLLRDLADASTVLTNSLTAYLGLPIHDPKLVSILRQHGAISHGLHSSGQETRQRVDALRKRAGTGYGEDIPLDRKLIVDWCISRLEQWGRSAGMEIFRDEERDGRITIVLGGKVLVIDVDFAVQRSPSSKPRIDVANVKTSHATPSGASQNAEAERSASLDDFILRSLRRYLEEVQRGDSVPDSTKAQRLASGLEGHFSYLMKLDLLASQEGDSGIRWFDDIGTLSSTMNQAANLEAAAVASSLFVPAAPLDIFLLRAHALPLPHLTSPSISFLTYVSPLAYLTITRSPDVQTRSSTDPVSKLDTPSSVLRSLLSHSDSRPSGTIIANLFLTSSQQHHGHPDSQHLPSLGTRPTFNLPTAASLADVDYIFPVPLISSSNDVWMLDFTDDGATKGIVVSQSRMKEIQLVVNPLSAMYDMGVEMIPFGCASWVDLLLNPSNQPSERYTATYNSPTAAHPPLHLRLSVPVEPGFLLGRIRVRSLKEVWGVLEVVREQCWLNETLKTCTWYPEGLEVPEEEDKEVTDEDLQSILNGTFKTRRILVNVFVPYQPPPDSIFDSSGDLDTLTLPSTRSGPPRLVMTVQTRDASPSQLQITVGHDQMRPRGVRVDVSGSLPFTTAQVEKLEESARRGGILGLAGKVWSWNLS